MSITQNPELFFTQDRPSSVQRLTITATLLKAIVRPDYEWSRRWDPVYNKPDEMTVPTLGFIMEDYERRERKDASDAFHYDIAGYVIGAGLIGSSLVAPTTTAGKIASQLGNKAAGNASATALNELRNHGYAQTSEWLERQLIRLRKFHGYDDLSTVQTMTPTERLDVLKKGGIIDSLLDASVKDRDKPLMRDMALRVLDDRLKSSVSILGEHDAAQDEAVRKNARQIAAVNAALTDFMDSTRDELKGIHETQSEIQQQVGVLAGQVGKNSTDIAFLQGFLFERMSPNEQLATLKSGFFAEMPEAERKRLETKIGLIEQRQKLLSAVATYSESATTVARIAARVGVDPNVVGVIQKSAQIASAASTIATGLLSGGLGYLAAADAISGLVFGTGSDVGVQRHEQIMQALSEIRHELEDVKLMLADIQKGINLIIDNQRRIYEAIIELSKQVDVNYQNTMAELTKIRQDIDAAREIANQILDTNIGACFTFKDRLKSEGFSQLHSIEFSSLCDIFRDHGIRGLEGLKERLSNPLEVGGYHLSHYTKVGRPSDVFLQMYRALYAFVGPHVLAKNLDRYLLALAIPVATFEAVAAKRQAIIISNPPQYNLFHMSHSWDIRATLLEEPISPEAISKHLEYLIFLHPFFEMRDALVENDREKFFSLEGSSSEGRFLLQTALDLVRTAIMHHVLISGDVLLDDLDTIWEQGFDGSTPRAGESEALAQQRAAPWVKLKSILPQQTLLRQNLVCFSIMKIIRARSSLLAYTTAYGINGDATYMQEILPRNRFALSWIEPSVGEKPRADPVLLDRSTGWHINIDGNRYPLPHPDELLAGKMVTSPTLNTLTRLRAELSGELCGYTVPHNLDKNQRLALRRCAWGAAEIT